MTTREKILLALMGVAVTAGAVQFGLSLLSPVAPAGQADVLQEARTVAGEVTARLQTLPLSEGQRYVLAVSLRSAPRNPFQLPERGPAAPPGEAAAAGGLVYSGYVQVGKARLAIVGGLEYGVGDTLPNTGDVIRAIRSDGLVLYSPSRNAEWELPYTGDVM